MSIEGDVLRNGIRAARAGDATTALELLQVAVEREPRSVDAWLWLGLVVEDSADAEECFNRALILEPGNARATAYLKALKEGHAPELPAEDAAPAALTLAPKPAAPSELDRFRKSLGVSVESTPSPSPAASPLVALANIPPAQAVKPKSVAAAQPAKKTKSKAGKMPRFKLTTTQAVVAGLLGVWAMALFCALPAIWILFQMNGAAGSVGAFATLLPSPTPAAASDLIATARPTAQPTAAPTEPGVEAAAPTPAAPAVVVIEPALAAGRLFVQQERYLDARAALLPVVNAQPDLVEARALLAHADVGALIEAYDAEPQGLTPATAVQDADAAVAFAPTQGDLYLLRALAQAEALRRSDDVQARETLAASARADLEAATRLGVSGSAFSTWLPLLQARVGRCDDGYKTATQALAQGGRLTRERAWLQYGAALNAYCRARYDEAGSYSRQAAETLDGAFPQARELEILSLQARKRTTEALKKLDDWLAAEPATSARRLDLRAFLVYEAGDRAGAENDLSTAQVLGGSTGAWQAYTHGRLTVDGGSDAGWDSVRGAIVSLDPALGFLRERWVTVLAESGQDPVPLAQPIEASNAQAPEIANHGAPPPNAGLLMPLESGSTPLLLGQTATVLHFQSIEPLTLTQVDALRVEALGLQAGAPLDKIEVSLWDQSSKHWVPQTLTDAGTVLVKQPGRFVAAEGDVYVSIRLQVAERWGLRRLTLSIAGLRADGQGVQLGPDPSAPGDVSALTPAEQATALVDVDRLDAATAVLTTALDSAAPADRAAMLDQLAQVDFMRGDVAAAVDHMVAALAIESQPERHFVMGLAMDLTGDVGAARREYELAVAPGNPLSAVSRGLAEGRIAQLTR